MAEIDLIKISELPATSTIGDADELAVVQGGATKKVPYSVLKDGAEVMPDTTLSEAGVPADAAAVGAALAQKANQAAVTQALAAKADKTEVAGISDDIAELASVVERKADQTALNQKADKATTDALRQDLTTLNGIVNQKADKTELNAQIGNVTAELATKANTADVNNLLAAKANVASPVFTGRPQAPTAAKGTATLQLATTAFVQNAIDDKQDTLTFDSTPTEGSTNPVTSGGVFNAIPAIDNTLTVAGDAADAKATGEAITELKNDLDENVYDLKSDISELDSAVFKAIRQNLITKSNIRNGASSGANSIVVDKDNLTLTWDLTLSIGTDSSAITLSTVPLTLDTSKEYFFYARINALSNNTINNGAIGAQWFKDGQTPQYIGVAEQLWFSPTMSGIICSTFVPSRDNGYLRFVFNGMTTATKRINLFVDKLVFCEMPAGINVSEMEDAIASLDNPILDIRVEKNPCPSVDILFWGDSLTAGAGGNGTNYPSVCATELGKTYKNCGVGGEDCNTIAARQGGNNVVIPAGPVNGTYAHLYDIFGYELAPLLQGSGNNSGREIIVNGLNCQLVRSSDNYVISGYTGDALSVPTLARFAGSDFTGKIVTIWIGTNGGAFPGCTAGIDMRIAWINSMIKHIGHERYVILGLTVGEETASFYINEENRMKQAFGNKYFPTRKYLVESGLTIAGITPTSQDDTDIASGKVPTSLKSDSIHLNASGYTAVGKLLANKIRSLGYV